MCNHGASLLTTYFPRSNQEFFSRLFSLSEVTPECDMPLFVTFDHSLDFKGLSMHLNAGCPRLQLDRLIFPQMTHTLYFTESKQFRSQCVWKPDIDLGVSDPTLIIRSTLRRVNRLPLGAFLTLLPGEDSLALSAAFPPGKRNRKAKLHSVDVSMLGTVFNTEVNIDEDILRFTANADLYGNYRAQLSVSAQTNVTWDRMEFMVDGQLNYDTMKKFDEYVKNYILEEIINRAIERNRTATDAVIRASQTLNQLGTQLQMLDSRLTEAQENFDRAFVESRRANETLRNASAGVDTANTEISAAQNSFNQVCREEDCLDQIVRREVCQTCYQDVLTEEAGMCTVLQPLVPAPYFDELVGYITRTRWEFVNVCRRRCYRFTAFFFFSIRFCRRVCRSVCVPIVYSEPDIRRVQREVLVEVTESCDPPKQVLEQSIPARCCQSYEERVPNVQCREMCRSAQVQATDVLRKVNSETAEVFERVSEARRAVLAANTRLARATIQRDSAEQMRDRVRASYSNAEFAVVVSLLNQEKVTAEIKNELDIVRKYRNAGIGEVVALNGVEFKTEISTESPTILPLTFSYSSFGQDNITNIPFDFTATNELSMRLVAEEIASEILNSTSRLVRRSTLRYRRQDTDSDIATRSRNEETFQENCVLIENIKQYVQNILNTVEMIQESASSAIDTLHMSIESLQMQAESDTTDMDTVINFDALESLFNISRDEFSDESDEKIIESYRGYFRDLANTTDEILEGIDNTSFGEWQASMEMLHNESGSAAGHPCIGFADCLDSVSGLLKRLITDLRPGADKDTLQLQFDQNHQRFVQLATEMSLTIPLAVNVVTDMLETVNSETLSTYWCSSPPNITDQPPMQVNVSSGSDLTLECPYESSLPASAHWRKDGVPIPMSNTSTLVVPNANIMDGGNYTCHIANAVGMVSSLNVSVLVYELPEFFLVLKPLATYAGNETGTWFSCNASAWPYPGWRWYFRASESNPWTQFVGEDTNELTILSPQKENEGWYTCEAFNHHGYIRAPPVRLTVLPVSIPQLGIRIFTIATNFEEMISSYETKQRTVVNFIRYEISHLSGTIHNMNITVRIWLRSNTSVRMNITLLSENVTTEDTRKMSLREIEDIALPSRGDVILAKQWMQQLEEFGNGSIPIIDEYEHVNLVLYPSAFTFHTPEYFCPPGQALHSNFLLCGKYNDSLMLTSVYVLIIIMSMWLLVYLCWLCCIIDDCN